MSEQTDSVGGEVPEDPGAEVEAAIRQAMSAVLAEADSRAQAIGEEAAAHLQRAEEAEARAFAIERDARGMAERAAAEYESAVREEVKRARREALDAAQTRAAAIIEEAENEAAQIRKRAMDELSQSRLRAVREAERAAERARARLLKFADSAHEDLAALIAGIRKDAGGASPVRPAPSAPLAQPWDQRAA